MRLRIKIPAALGVALLAGCAAGPGERLAAIAPTDIAGPAPAVAVPPIPAGHRSPPGKLAAAPATLGEEAAAASSVEGTERPVPARIAATPGLVMIESAEDRADNDRQKIALHRMITKRDRIVGDVVDTR